MICALRLVFFTIYFILVCVFGSIYCLFNPRNPKNVAIFSHIFGQLAPLFGLKVETRLPKEAKKFGNAIYIANHQNNFDMVTISNILLPSTVTVGKKNLLWIPFFGQLYWLTGNILIDRKNHSKAYNAIFQIVNKLKKNRISILMFPEGTRSYNWNLLPFKMGAFYIAIAAGVPIIPICVSSTSNKINLNKLNNGLVIVEMLDPIDVCKYKKNQVHKLASYCHKLMVEKIIALNKEILQKEFNIKNK